MTRTETQPPLFPESDFTAPHEACPRPGLWHSPDSDSTEHEVSLLVGALVRALQPGLVVETGTAFGHTTLEIDRALRANGHGRLVTLEVDPNRRWAAGELLAADQPPHERHTVRTWDASSVTVGRTELRLQPSLEYEPPEPVGFAWFDSLYELRVDEFLRYRRLGAVPPGTVVGFHDWTSGLRGHHMDVRREVEERLVAPGLLRAVHLPTPRGATIGQAL